jgi:hypothetical protein
MLKCLTIEKILNIKIVENLKFDYVEKNYVLNVLKFLKKENNMFL